MTNNKKNPSAANTSRRDFIKKSAVAATAMAAGYSSKIADAVAEKKAPLTGAILGANDRLVLGFIGCGGQGLHAHMRSVTNIAGNGNPFHSYEFNAVAAAACDLYAMRRQSAYELMLASQNNKGLTGYELEVYEDYGDLLDRQDIDAVFIGTVDHWHRKMTIDALEAGKHIYCEKPMTRYLGEAWEIYDAVQQSGKKFQIGTQYCSEGKWHKAAELVRNGMIGPLVSCQNSYCRNTVDGEWNYYVIEPELTPEMMNWQKWLGPVSDRPFNPEHFFRWRKYYAYCVGVLGDLLAHMIHPLLVATGDPEFPVRVGSVGNKKITDMYLGPEDRDVTDNVVIMAEFPSGLNMVVTGATVNEQGLGQVIRGNEATIYFGGNSVELRPERPFADLVDQENFENLEPGVSVPAHCADFFDAIRNDGETTGNIDLAMKAQAIISMSEMSERLGEMVFLDPETRKLSTGSGKELEAITYGSMEKS